jgi:hypothetical protein
MKTYTLHLVPEDGATTFETSDREFINGFNFRVLSSDFHPFKRGSYTNVADVRAMMKHYAIRFDVTFKTMTKVDALRQEASHSYVAQQAVELLEDGGFKI